MVPVLREELGDASQVRCPQRLRHARGHLLHGAQRLRHTWIPALVRRHDPRDGRARHAGPSRVAQHGAALQVCREGGGERDRLRADVGVAEREALEAAQCRGELILLSAGDPRLDGLEIPRLLGDLALGQVVGARQRQGADQRDVHRSRAAQTRPRGRVRARRERAGALDRKHAQRRLQEVQPAVQHESSRIDALELLSQILRHEADPRAAELHLDAGREIDRRAHHHAAFAGGEGRDVGPAAREVQAHGRRRAEFRGHVAPPHGAVRHAVTLGSSPRRSIRTPCTRRFIPCSPRP